MFRDGFKFLGTIKPEWGIDNVIRNTEPYGNISSSNYYINKVAPTGVLSARPNREENKPSSKNGSSSKSNSGKKAGQSAY